MKKGVILLSFIVLASLTGCGVAVKEKDVSENISENSTGTSIESTGDITTGMLSGNILTGEGNVESIEKQGEDTVPVSNTGEE